MSAPNNRGCDRRRIEWRAVRGRRLAWVIELWDERPVRRTLIDTGTGEVLDQAWLDVHGRVRSWSKVAVTAEAPSADRASRPGRPGQARRAPMRCRLAVQGRGSGGGSLLVAALERGAAIAGAV